MAASPGFPVRPRGKKRPNSPGSARPGEPPAGKKRKTVGVEGNFEAQELVEITAEMSTELPPKSFPFKDPNFTNYLPDSKDPTESITKSRRVNAATLNKLNSCHLQSDVRSGPPVRETLGPKPFLGRLHKHSSLGGPGVRKSRVWKNLKQILTAERNAGWNPNLPTYSNIEAPPSFKPAKKYSDLTGLIAPYSDPLTKLRFATAEEFSRLRSLPPDVAAGYLALRKAHALIA